MVQVSGTDELCPDYKNSNSENKKVCPLEKRHWAKRISKYCVPLFLFISQVSLSYFACSITKLTSSKKRSKKRNELFAVRVYEIVMRLQTLLDEFSTVTKY